MKATPEEYAWHQRLLAYDDSTAPAEMAEWLYEALMRETYARVCATAVGGVSSVDTALVEEAVGQALLDYLEGPERYDPELASLQRYLVMAAHRDFQNMSQKEARQTRSQRYLTLLTPEQEEPDLIDEQQDIDRVIARIDAENLWLQVQAYFPDPIERQIVGLLVDRVRSSQPYVQLLGLTHLSADEQAEAVKRVKDRLARRLRRIGENLDE
ncbi:MAG TPA: hypothetical protein VKT82_16460 [Ktedonobacterales bacterium]|nr:hypothetical protein [Ktedonobacterales bacterium]